MVEKEYAKALFDLAIEEKKEVEFSENMEALLKVVEKEEEFMKLMASPFLDELEKKKILDKVFNGLHPDILIFLQVLIDNHRFQCLEKIIKEFQQLLEEYKNILRVEVVSSEELESSRFKEVTKLLKKRYPDKKLIIENRVNPDILYGMQIICNGQSIDMSLKNMLNKMKDSL